MCDHYITKKCSNLYYPCCKQEFPCHRCHKEKCTSELKAIHISCLKCNQKQDLSNKCISCNIQFDNYFCNICQLWSPNNCFHCEQCGICRVGIRENIFHCSDCKICVHKPHICIKKYNSYNDICVVCHDNLFDSLKNAGPNKCGHIFHKECIKNHIHCPLCHKYIHDNSQIYEYHIRLFMNRFAVIFDYSINDIVITPMGSFVIDNIRDNMLVGRFTKINAKGIINRNYGIPEKFYRKIYCYECYYKGYSSILNPYHKCRKCKKYNTCII